MDVTLYTLAVTKNVVNTTTTQVITHNRASMSTITSEIVLPTVPSTPDWMMQETSAKGNGTYNLRVIAIGPWIAGIFDNN